MGVRIWDAVKIVYFNDEELESLKSVKSVTSALKDPSLQSILLQIDSAPDRYLNGVVLSIESKCQAVFFTSVYYTL